MFLSEVFSSLGDWLKGLPPTGQAVMTFFISMVPVIELRGAIPVAAVAGLPWYTAFFVSAIGNMAPVPFIVAYTRRVFLWMKDRNRLAGAVYRLEKRALAKAGKLYRYELIGLCLFVAMPLPGTGAWTGALIAALLDMRLKNAFPAILAGVVIAAAVVTGLTYTAAGILSS
ncbi:MAG: small multi-drug export protein [Oscillospiraceae bacterium]|jgi:uncharacterized membrane protein|nr:small multi-drug export protein [Oscillospiraceae bacterium]